MAVPLIFNHLDITVIVHETEISRRQGTYEHGGTTTNVKFGGHSFSIPIPQKTVRIVGFEVTPRSIPLGMACMPLGDVNTDEFTVSGG